ncbi:MAG TPA: DUF2079 domain-containing protein, partial [Trebonia sp.]
FNVAAIGLLLGVTAARPARRGRRAGRPAAAPGSVWRDPATWTVAAAVFGAYFVISLFRLLQLAPGSYDFGIYTEYVKQLSQLHAPVVDALGPGFNLLGNHFQVALALLAPLFRVFPSPATLLFSQALLAAVSVFPVAAAAQVFTGRNTARLIGFAYGFSWGLQQMISFDFHEIALAVPLLAFSVSALVRRRPAAVVAWAVPLVFVKEDQGFNVAAIGLLLGVTAAFPPDLSRGWRSRLPHPGGPDRWGDGRLALWGGLFLIAWGLAWSVFAITVIIPHFNPQHAYYFWQDGGTLGGKQPFSVGSLIVQSGGGWPAKAQTLLMLLLPTAFAALGSPVALLALPSLALRFVSTNSLFWGTQFHYDAAVMPILFIAAAEAIGRMRGDPLLAAPALPGSAFPGSAFPGFAFPESAFARAVWRARLALDFLDPVREVIRAARAGVARHGGAMMAAIAVALAFQFPLHTLWQSGTYRLDAHDAAAGAAMAVVPDGATVQTNMDLLAPLAARTDTFWLGNAGNPVTQYIVFDGDDSGYSPNISAVPAFIRMLYPRDGYVQVFERDDVYVYRRG